MYQLKFFKRKCILLLYWLFNHYLIFWRYKYLSHTVEEFSILLFYKPDPYFTSVIIITFFIHILKSVQLATRNVKRNTAKISPQSNEGASRRATPTTHDTLHFLNYRNSGLNMEIKRPTRCNRWFFIAKLIFRSTCFGLHYVHHQELTSIIQIVAACGTWWFGLQVVGLVWSCRLCVRFVGCCSTVTPQQTNNL